MVNVSVLAPLMTPLIVITLVELFAHVWFAPNMTGALSVSPAAPEFIVRPPVPSVSLIVVGSPEAIVMLFVLVGDVPRIVRLLIEKLVPSVVLKFDVALVVVKKTSVVLSGRPTFVVPPASEYQLLKPLPLTVFQVLLTSP